MLGIVAAGLAGYGAYLLYTAFAFGWGGIGPGPIARRRSPRATVRWWLAQAGLADVRPVEFAATSVAFAAAGGAVAFVLFGGLLPSVLAAVCGAVLPAAAHRRRRAQRQAAAKEAWPRMLEELRLLTGSLGRSVPQALFEVGRRAPAELVPAFAAAEREWLLTTDFPRTASVLTNRLADPTADVVCETLVVAHDIGGTELDRRLADLIEDRVADLHGRRDAEVALAGVRFARRFVLLVPLGMALAGLSIGSGRSAYSTPGGQLAVAAGLLGVAACWYWSGRLMRLPSEPRVFGPDRPARGSGGDAGRGPTPDAVGVAP